MALTDVILDKLQETGILTKPIGNGSIDFNYAYGLATLLGHQPVSILSKNYPYIYDTLIGSMERQGVEGGLTFTETAKEFTYYLERPNIRVADPDNDTRDFSYVPTEFITGSMNTNMEAGHTSAPIEKQYADFEYGQHDIQDIDANNGAYTGRYSSYAADTGVNDIIQKTNAGFKRTAQYNISRNFKTIVSRFHTDPVDFDDTTQTAISEQYGMSHGRNLLKLNPDFPNGYENPYCRVWTYHHQYHRLADAIRPFQDGTDDEPFLRTQSVLESENNWAAFRSPSDGSDDGFGSGGQRLDDYGVMNVHNGLVNCSPIWNDFNDDPTVDVKKCMFSIENLAWKGVGRTKTKDEKRLFDIDGLSPEQKGPLGGRIMWFPPYGLTFSEQVSPNWSETNIIGRGEGIYTYTNTVRTGQLSFLILADHPSIIDYMVKDTGSDYPSQGVDDLTSDENRILRFFAGCEILDAETQKINIGVSKPDPEPEQPKEEEKEEIQSDPDEAEEVPEPEVRKIVFVVFYPNNYSGLSDRSGTVKAMDYLINGVGTQMGFEYNESGTYDTWNPVDIPVTMDKWVGDAAGAGGYEIRGTNGVSVISTNTTSPLILGNALPNSPIVAQRGSDKYVLSKQFGSLTDKKLYPSSGSQAAKVNWYKRKWCYRVDKTNDVVNQVLRGGKNNYVDTKSFRLNAKGYSTSKAFFKIEGDDIDFVSFADVYRALNELKGNNDVTSLLSDVTDDANVNIIKSALSCTVKSILAEGYASSHGSNASAQTNINRNKGLHMQRAETINLWLSSMGVKSDQTPVVTGHTEEGKQVGDVSALDPKMYRSAKVTIEYEVPVDEKLVAENEQTYQVDGAGNVSQKSYTTGHAPWKVAYDWCVENKDLLWDIYNKVTSADTASTEEDTEETNGIVDNTYRYDNEARYFQELSLKDPVLHHQIKDKIKYFDPAFHSITPEGFNARLTFLHQCTRQGPTVGGADGANSSTANNLAFGRAPVCVLRIGDFYYTKIIIDSLTINYEGPQWDLNPEGVGVQPMLAKVDIGFKFIGGSDLAGPIARLQNALSFNYYANTGVYDNRAEQVMYAEDGTVAKFRPFLAAGERLKSESKGDENASKTAEVKQSGPEVQQNQTNEMSPQAQQIEEMSKQQSGPINNVNKMRKQETTKNPDEPKKENRSNNFPNTITRRRGDGIY